MKNVYCLLGGLLCLLFSQSVKAQTVENIVASFDGEKISITYDLNHNVVEHKFIISLYSSHNGFQNPLTLVTGDVGNDIPSGKGKKVIWNVRSELPPYFNDELAFKVKAKLIALPITETKEAIALNTEEKVKEPTTSVINEEVKEPKTLDIKEVVTYKIKPLQSSGYKRGGELKLQWEGGATSDNIKVDLLKNNVVWQPLMPTQNTYSYQWQIPKKQTKGKNYAIRISSATNPTQKSTSEVFKIKSKTPFIVKVGIPIIIGALVGVLVIGKDNGGEIPNNNQLSELPGPITPGGG